MTMNREAATPPVQLVSTEEVLRRMRAGTKETYVIRMREYELPVRVLTIDELARVRRESIKNVALIQGDETDRNIFVQKAVLKIASTLTPGGGPNISDATLGLLSTDEIQHLYSEYVKVADDVNPALENLKPDEFRALIDGVKKNAIVAKDCSLRQLRAIFTAFQDLIQQQESRTSLPDNSSGGQL